MAAIGGGVMAEAVLPLSLSLSILRSEQRKNEAKSKFYNRMSDGICRRNSNGFFRWNIQKF